MHKNKMKLLILTQKVDINDDVLGFFHGWIREFAKNCDKITVVCLQKGEYDLPGNVEVLSLGKEGGASRIKYIFRFYKYIWQKRKDYDHVFVHMNQIYVLLGGVFWRIWGKKIILWYAHKHVNLSLRLSDKFANVVFTASKKSFRFNSKKLKVLGHGIDVDKFKKRKLDSKNDIFKIITVGRISPVKDYETFLSALSLLKEKNIKISVDIVGGPGTPEQIEYFEKLKNKVKEKKLYFVNFLGPIPNKDIVEYIQASDLFVHMSKTGSLDKSILEAMACEIPVLSCNDSSKDVFGEKYKDYFYSKGDFEELSYKIEKMIKTGKNDRIKVGQEFRRIVVNNHNLSFLIKKIILNINEEAG